MSAKKCEGRRIQHLEDAYPDALPKGQRARRGVAKGIPGIRSDKKQVSSGA